MKVLAFLPLLVILGSCNKAATNEAKPNHPEPTALAADTVPAAISKGTEPEPANVPATVPDISDSNDPDTDNPGSRPAASSVGSQSESEISPIGVEPQEQGLREGSVRLLLPTTAGILIVDAEIEINGKTIQDNFNLQIDDVLTNAAQEADQTTWPELFKHVAANPTRFNASLQVNRPQYRAMRNRYDQNRNGQADRRETAKYLFQSSPTSAPFRLFGTDSYRHSNRSKSPAFVAIDTDGNRVLDTSEINQATASLQTLDRNSDRRIEANETITESTSPSSVALTDPWKRSRSKRWGEVAMDLSGHVDWPMLSYMIGNLNRPGPFGQDSGLLTILDLDDDQSLSAEEAKGLMKVNPDLRIRIAYASDSQETIKIESVSSQVEPLVKTDQSPSQIQVVGESFTLVAQVMPSQVGGNQFPDQAFVMLDANKDGFLDQNEIPEPALQQYSFDDIDSNNDGKLTIQEIRTGMAGEEPFWFIQVRARGAESADAVFGWFDQNHDNFLSTREIDGVPNRLRSLAIDGEVRPSDIPDRFLLQFGRGDPNQDSQLFAMIPTKPTIDTRPRWAQAMDSNRDGDISPDEFTGRTELFIAMDKNGDGFIGPDETDSP